MQTLATEEFDARWARAIYTNDARSQWNMASLKECGLSPNLSIWNILAT